MALCHSGSYLEQTKFNFFPCLSDNLMIYSESAREKLNMPRKKIEGVCSVDGCDKPLKGSLYCRNHYMMNYLYGRTTKLHNGDKRNDPFYHLWFERKRNNLLCEAWLDFLIFKNDISPKPEGNFFLLQIDSSKPFGPNNFRWQELLKRKNGESNKDWWARKRAARIVANPSMESDRNLKRKFNLTRQEYDDKLKSQNYVCAICEQPETTYDGRTGGIRNLAVDHNHITNVVRDLLCWRCNSTIGKINENAELLDKMKSYLLKHK